MSNFKPDFPAGRREPIRQRLEVAARLRTLPRRASNLQIENRTLGIFRPALKKFPGACSWQRRARIFPGLG
jgi:hypothetical protein